jgi:hypothetical protein
MADPTGGPPKGQLRPPLRLVRLLDPSKPAPRKKRRTPVFTEAQEAWIRSALRNARALFSTWACLADAMGASKNSIMAAASGKGRVSAVIVVRLASATGLSVDTLLHPSIVAAGRCPTCGRSREARE